MSKKRRGFDIDLDTDEAGDTGTNPPVSVTFDPAAQRRGPMATAITETAGSLRDRAVIEAQIRAENDALAHEHVRLKKLGLITELVPLDQIDAAKLVRDRAQTADPELANMVTSIREIGLSNPIRIEEQADGRYELVQGYRRLAAYRALLAETGDAVQYGRIPATIIAGGDTLERLYRQMVDENLVRKDISFAEMAQMAIMYAAEPQINEPEPARVVARLFGSANYAKRSYIRSFVGLMQTLGADLLFAPEIPRALGLTLAEKLLKQPGLAAAIRADLCSFPGRSARDELDLLRRHAGVSDSEDRVFVAPAVIVQHKPPAPRNAGPALAGPALAGSPVKISFQLHTALGLVNVTAAAGRIDLRLDCDTTQIDRMRLEAAVQAMMDQLN